MNVDVYIFNFLCSVLRVSPDTDPSRRDRSVSVPAESAAETATVSHDLFSRPRVLGQHWYSKPERCLPSLYALTSPIESV